jgi:hypothetical protein
MHNITINLKIRFSFSQSAFASGAWTRILETKFKLKVRQHEGRSEERK